MKQALEHLKIKWKIRSSLDALLICLTFSLAGTSILFERPFIFHVTGLDKTHLFIQIISYPFLIFPVFQLNLLLFGTALGQFSFFLEKERKLVEFIARPFKTSGKA